MALRKGGVIAALGALLLAAPAGYAQDAGTVAAATAPAWGVLAQVAEREFASGPLLVTFRWSVPGERLDMIRWAPLGRETMFIERGPIPGELRWKNVAPFRNDLIAPMRVEADGSISAALRKDEYTPWLKALPNGSYQFLGARLDPLEPASKQGQRLAKLIADGKITAGQPAPLVAAPIQSTGPTAPVSAAAALAQNYAQLCGAASQAGSETCVALRKALAAQIAEAKKAPPLTATIGRPLGVRVVGGSGAQVRAEIVAIDPAGAAARAGLMVGDALLYAKGADGDRTFFGDQASIDAWAARQAAGSAHELAYARKGEAAVRSAMVRLAAPAGR